MHDELMRTPALPRELLAPEEPILWQGRPVFWPFVANSLWSTAMGLFWLIAISQAWRQFGRAVPAGGRRDGLDYLFFAPFFVVGALMLVAPAFVAITHRRTRFTLTDRRLVFEDGFLARRIKVVLLAKVVHVAAVAGPVERLFGVGTVQVFSGELTMGRRPQSRFDALESIPRHMQVFELIQRQLDRFGKDREGTAR